MQPCSYILAHTSLFIQPSPYSTYSPVHTAQLLHSLQSFLMRFSLYFTAYIVQPCSYILGDASLLIHACSYIPFHTAKLIVRLIQPSPYSPAHTVQPIQPSSYILAHTVQLILYSLDNTALLIQPWSSLTVLRQIYKDRTGLAQYHLFLLRPHTLSSIQVSSKSTKPSIS